MSHKVTYLENLRRAFHAVMEQNPSVVVLGEDTLDPYGGAFKVTQGLSTRFPNRVLTTPICEQTIVGISIGLALRGLRPIVEIMFGDFLALAADQIVNHAAKYHAMYNGRVVVPLVIRTPMGGGRGYGPTHSQSLEKLFFGIPHLKIVAPSHFHDVGAMLRAAVEDTEPVLFIENKLLYPQPLRLGSEQNGSSRIQVNVPNDYPCVLLRNCPPSSKPDVTVIAYGGISRLLEPLLIRLGHEEIRILVCLPGCLSPVVDEPILACAQETGRVVIVEESQTDFGWGAEVASRIYDVMYSQLYCPIQRVGAARTVIPASKPLEDQVLVSEKTIQSAILETMKW